MGDWATYQLQDFIPFDADVYFRLLARMGEHFWPLQLATLALGIVALILAVAGRGRVALALVAPLWAFIGVAFFAQRYAALNWAGGTFCWAWLLQCLLLLLAAVTGRGIAPSAPLFSVPGSSATGSIATGSSASVQAGLLVSGCGLVGYPLLAVALGSGWSQGEAFGLHPDPTAVVTLGILLMVARGPWLWALTLVPLLWLLVSGVTLKVLGSPWYPALFAIMAVVFAGLLSGRHSQVAR
ncbi:DUF6064 family protein [Microbulbifer sp. CAU 1566]|uniref:DUF6064 family protein n=1 Tax=Microbulbifer sp. CAU 1566 TaxID=2933269 RepID=UPI002005FC73|nr:DUF6064 family protein [Microbulbifer sp. CAU 1566]MCK7595948.1 DUF6064 family protein [Microbulbifer sp. CAU 1566]